MKTVGVIIGTETGWISDGYYKKNRKKLDYLDTLDSSILYKSESVPYDYAILCEFKALEKKFKVNVVPLHGPTLTLKDANECDFIFCIYEAVFSFGDGGYKGYNNYMNVLSKTKAMVHPPVKVQKFIINKQAYMGWLEKLGFDIIPTKFINITSYNNNKKKTLESIHRFREKGSYKELIMKPELGLFAGGFKHYKKVTDKSMTRYLDKVSKKGFKKVLVQPYIPEFLKYYEIKTFWLNGKYLYAYGINVIGLKDDVYPEAVGGTLPDEYVNSCRKTGEKIIKELFKEYGSLAELRIDFGCCIDNDNLCRDYFVNEIEVLPSIIDDETKTDNFRLLAKTVLERV